MAHGKNLLRVACILAAFQPNCTRECPTGFLSCTCKWDWDECPPPPSCGSSSAAVASNDAGMLAVELGDGALVQRAADAASFAVQADEPMGGTLAFAHAASGTFAVAVIPELDIARIIRVDVMDGRLRAHVLGDVSFGRARAPTRVVPDDRGLAHVVLRGTGEIATLDPTTLTIVARQRACPSPRSLAFDRRAGGIVVACESGDLVTLDSTGLETKRTFVDRGLRDVAVQGDTVFASTRARLFVMGSNGTFATHDDGRALDAFAPRGANIVIAHADGLELAPLDGHPGRALEDATTSVSDIAVGDDGTIIVAAAGKALVLTTGAPNFSTLSTSGFVTAVAISQDGPLTVLGVETSEATVALTLLTETAPFVIVE